MVYIINLGFVLNVVIYLRKSINIQPGHIKDLSACPRCLNCYPLNKPISNLEKELVEFCKQYYPNLKENDKSLIKPKELDIVIPELKLAIEFNRRLLAFNASSVKIKIII